MIFFPLILKKGVYDYAHFQYILPFFLSKKTKFITTIHDIIPIDFPKYYSIFYRLKVNLLFRRAAKKSDLLLTVSEYSKNRISIRFKIPSEKIHVTENAVKDIFIKENNFPVSSKKNYENYFLYVSRIEERKNHLMLLKAFVDGKFYKNFFLIFVGSGSFKNSEFYKYYVSLESKIKSRVNFFTGLSDNELENVYKNASLFIYPSIAEGFGIPPLEAAICLKKVVCSNSTAMSDFDFFNEYSFNPLDENELINQIRKILIDKDYPAERIKNEITNKYSWKRSAEILKKALLENE